MNRCIHCTRCIRFYKEVEFIASFSLLGRGEDSEIVLNKVNLLSILSGNVIDICPVGALTSKVYTFIGRPWELNKYENIDILDSMCSSISVHLRGDKILRILPVSDSLLNTDWITNITRYFFDFLVTQRFLNPYLTMGSKVYLRLSWSIVTKIVINQLIDYLLKGKGLNFILDDFLDLETLYYVKQFNLNLGYLNVNLLQPIYNNSDLTCLFFFNSNLKNLRNYKIFFFLALNLRLRMPVLNARLRQLLKKRKIKIFSLGFSSYDISLSIKNLGNNLVSFFNILENKSVFSLSLFYNSFFLSSFIKLSNYVNKALIVGDNFFFLKNCYKLLLNFCHFFSFFYKDLYILFVNVIDLNFQELFFKQSNKRFLNNSFIYSFSDNIIFTAKSLKLKKFNFFSVLQRSIFSKKSKRFNLVLPTTAFFEYSGLFFNFFGSLRSKLKIYSYNLNLKSNLDIMKYFSYILNFSLSFVKLPSYCLFYFSKFLLNRKTTNLYK